MSFKIPISDIEDREELFEFCMIRASADLLNKERYYKKPYEQMEHHQQIRCHTDAKRAMEMLTLAIKRFREIIKDE